MAELGLNFKLVFLKKKLVVLSFIYHDYVTEVRFVTFSQSSVSQISIRWFVCVRVCVYTRVYVCTFCILLPRTQPEK